VKKEIVNKCSELFGVPAEDILSRKRRRSIARARFALYKALRGRGWSYLAIGAFIGRDHATVIYGVRVAEHLMSRDEWYAENIDTLVALKPAAFAQKEMQL
jgi:chromosomal replication initiator protein